MSSTETLHSNDESRVSTAVVFRQVLVAFLASLTIFSIGLQGGWPAIALPRLRSNASRIEMTPEETSWVVSLEDVGVFISPFPAGYLMDMLGRKYSILFAGAISLSSWILTGVALDSWFYYVSRLLSGLSKGAIFTVLPVYIGEISSVPIRGTLSTVPNACFWFGIVLENVVGHFVNLTTAAILSSLIPIMFLLVFPFMPDSPYFLAMKGKREEALKALRFLRGSSSNDINNGCEYSVSKEFDYIIINVKEKMKNKTKFTDLISSASNRRALLIVVTTTSLYKLAGVSCLGMYSSTTLPPSDVFFGPETATTIYCVIYFIVSVLLAPLVDSFGRRPLLLSSAAASGVVTGTTAIFYFLDRETKVDMSKFHWVPYICLFVSGMVQPPINTIPNTLQGELFPTTIKSKASAVCICIFAIASFFTSKLYVTVDITIGMYANFLFFFASSLVYAIFVYLFVFETKNKSFTEIQEILSAKTNS